MDEFSNPLQQYIVKNVDVRPNENCGYRAITTLLGQGEELWALVRQDFIRKLKTWDS